MTKVVVSYLFTTFAIAALGAVLVMFGAITGKEHPAFVSVAILGALLFWCSPGFPALWFWYKRAKARKKAHRIAIVEHMEKQRLADEQRSKDFLRHRFLERQRLIDAVDRHRTALTRNLERGLKKNDYGVIVADMTGDALQEFFASIDLDAEYLPITDASEVVFEQLDFRKMEDRTAGFLSNNLPFDGHSFEAWVAEALVGFGWEAEVTPRSGDQGIDVIAKKNGKKLGLQCKLYSTPIGNKAVQEAHAGKVYYGADAAGVLTNAAFTSSAKDLAAVTGIKLFSHHDIPQLYEKTFGSL